MPETLETRLVADAYALAVRHRILAATDRAVALAGRPCPTQAIFEALGAGPPLAATPRQLAHLLRRVAATGADDEGLALIHVGSDRQSAECWTVCPQPRQAAPHLAQVARIEALCAALRTPGDATALDVVERVLLAELARSK